MTRAMASGIELITDLGRFAEIKPQWNALWRRCRARVFQTHEWIETWLQASRGYATPRIAVAWCDDELLAAVPLAIRRRFGLRTLEWAAQILSDYCDALATPGATLQLAPLWQAICEAGGFTFVNLKQVGPDAVMRPILDRDQTGRMRINRRDDVQRCLGIERAWPDGETWFRSLGKKGRNNFWRGERILAGLGGEVAFHCLDPTERAIDTELRHAMELKREWLRTKDPDSPLLGRDGEILEAMLGAIYGTGLLRLFVLTSGDRMAAASVNFVAADTMEAFLTCYDTAYSRSSPGTLLMVHYTRWAFDKGLRKIDFLRGDEPFKWHFANCTLGLATYTGARTTVGKSLLAARRCYSTWQGGNRPPAPAVADTHGSAAHSSDLAVGH